MKTILIAVPLCALAVVYPSNVSAQQLNIKPGLWQYDMKIPGQMPANAMAGYIEQMKSQMAAMPPEQRKQIASTLADFEARGTEFTSDGVRTKVCLTKENITNADLLDNKGMESCTRKTSPSAGGMKLSMACTRPTMSVDANLRYQGEKAFAFESTATVPGPDGKPMIQKSTGTAKWLSGECGTVKPASGKG